MDTTDTLRRRMEHLDDLRHIVRTMKALSAVGSRQNERAAAALAPLVKGDLTTLPSPGFTAGITAR